MKREARPIPFQSATRAMGQNRPKPLAAPDRHPKSCRWTNLRGEACASIVFLIVFSCWLTVPLDSSAQSGTIDATIETGASTDFESFPGPAYPSIITVNGSPMESGQRRKLNISSGQPIHVRIELDIRTVQDLEGEPVTLHLPTTDAVFVEGGCSPHKIEFLEEWWGWSDSGNGYSEVGGTPTFIFVGSDFVYVEGAEAGYLSPKTTEALVYLSDPNKRDCGCGGSPSGAPSPNSASSGSGESNDSYTDFTPATFHDSFANGFTGTGGETPTGLLELAVPVTSATAITPSDFVFTVDEDYEEDTTDTTSSGVRIIESPHSRVEMESTAAGLEVRVHDDPAPGSDPDYTFVYSRVQDPAYGDGLKVTREKAGGEGPNSFERYESVSPDGLTADYKVVHDDGSVTEGTATIIDGGEGITYDEYEKAPDGEGGFEIADRYFTHRVMKPWGEDLVETVRGLGDDAVTTWNTYYDASAPAHLRGRLHYWTDSGGDWERRLYDSEGELAETLRPWKDGPANPALATRHNSRATVHLDENTTETWIAGVKMATRETIQATTPYPLGGAPAVEVIERTTTPGGAVSESISYYEPGSGTEEYGDLLGTLDPGGVLTSFVSEEGSFDESTRTFTPGAGAATREFTVQGTLASPEGIAHRTTREVRISDDTGTRFTETQVFTGGGSYALLTRTDHHYDGEGRLVETVTDGDTVSATTHHADGSRTETYSDGSSVTLVEGEDGESSRTWHGGGLFEDILTETTVDGQTTTTVRSAGGLALASATVTSPGGRLLATTDEQGRTTTWHRDPNTGAEIETGPGGVTRVTARYRDGQLKSVTGSGVLPEYHDHEVRPDGTLATTVHTGAPDSPRWRRTVTDGLGRVLRVERPGPGGGTLAEQRHYDTHGRLVRVERPGLADEITAYDDLGFPHWRGLDLDGSGALEPGGTDRIAESASYYENDSGWWRVEEQLAYLEGGSAAATLQSRTRTRLGLGAESLVESLDARGRLVTRSTSVDPATGTATTTSSASFSDLDAVSVTRYGRLVSQSSFTVAEPVLYGYDALGRPVTVTDPRTGLATTTAYNAAGQVESVTRPGPNGPLVESFGYYPATHPNAGQLHWSEDPLGQRRTLAYDSLGRTTHQWGAAEYPRRHVYNALGDLAELHTFRGGTSADWDGPSLPGGFASGQADTTTWVRDPGTGLLLQKLDASGQGPTYIYHPSGLLATRTRARGVTSTYTYNPAGEVLSVTHSDGTPGATRSYRRDGSIASVTDAAGTTTYSYTNPGGSVSGESITGGLLDGLSLSYPETQGRRQSFTASLGAATLSQMDYAYDTVGRLARVSDPGLGSAGFSAEYGYVPDSDLLQSTVSKNGTTPVISAGRSYDTAGRLGAVTNLDPATSAAVASHAYTLDAAGRRIRAEREDGTRWDYGYNSRGEVISAAKSLSDGTPLAGWQESFSYDSIGNRRSSAEGGDSSGANLRQSSYAANELNQYTQITRPGGYHVVGLAPSSVDVEVNGEAANRQGDHWHKEFDGISNELGAQWESVEVKATDPGAGTSGEDLVALRQGNRYIPPAVVEPAYDADGNLLEDGRWSYTWDAENRLVEVTTAPAALNAGAPKLRYLYDYDSQNRRIRRQVESWDHATSAWVLETSERFVHDQWNVVAVIDDSGALVQRHVWGNDISGTPQGAGGVGGLLATWDDASNRAWCHAYDGNGNVSAVVDLDDASKVGLYDYDAFGRLVALWGDEALAEANRYRFSTKPEEGTGLVYYGFRYCDPEHGRWLSRDPIEEEGGVNLYGFVGNDAIEKWDRLGMAYGEHLTKEEAKSLACAIKFFLIDAKAANALFLRGEDDVSMTIKMLSHYMSKKGTDFTVSESKLKSDPGMQLANRDAKNHFKSGGIAPYIRRGIHTTGDLSTAIGRTTAKYTTGTEYIPSMPMTMGVPMPGITIHVIHGELLGERYTFLDTKPGDPVNVTFPFLNLEGFLCCWKGGNNISDQWMADLERYGYAKSYNVKGNWTFRR